MGASASRGTTRRTRTAHPGVVLLRPDEASRHTHWRARWTDPDSGKVTKLSLANLTTAEARRAWAIRKSKEITKRRLALEAGAPKLSGTSVADGVATYFADHPALRETTKVLYRAATAKLEAWAQQAKVRSLDDLTLGALTAFRATLATQPRQAADGGGKRGARKVTERKRRPATVNRELRSVRTVLGYLRKRGLTPRLTSDDLRDGLERQQQSTDEIEHMRSAELRQLLRAALEHDSAKHKMTRLEKGRGLMPGGTPKHEAIAPFVALVLLTGMRFSEAATLTWEQIRVDDEPGEIALTSAGTKTKQARTIWLDASPGLRELLVALKPKPATGPVWPQTAETLRAGGKRLLAEYGAPASFGWQVLRRTCGTFLTNSPGIYGAASAYQSARQLGHSVSVAEKHYVGRVRITHEAKTLEAAMGVEAELAAVIAAARGNA